MRLKNFAKALILTVLTSPVIAASSDSEHPNSDHQKDILEAHHGKDGVESAEDRAKFIEHHLADSHDFTIWHAVGLDIPLPVILIDEGLHVFSSSKFHHGHDVAESNGKYYFEDLGIVYRTDAEGNRLKTDSGSFIKPLDLSITKSVMMMIITGLLMFLLFRSLGKSYAKNGGISKGVGRFMEPIVLYIRDEIAIPNIGEKKYRRYMPYLLTVFFFVWFLNLFGLTPLGVNVTGNIAVTAALALITFLLTNLTGTKDYWKHIFDPLGDAMPWIAKIWIYIILIPIEILGIFIKPFSLMIRLYANMLAGHTVLMSLIALVYISATWSWVGDPLAIVLSFAISLIELLVALLQAYIFTMLSSLYFGFAAEEHEHHESHAH